MEKASSVRMLGAAPTVAELLYKRRMYGGGKRDV
jgi:hypothetical protein